MAHRVYSRYDCGISRSIAATASIAWSRKDWRAAAVTRVCTPHSVHMTLPPCQATSSACAVIAPRKPHSAISSAMLRRVSMSNENCASKVIHGLRAALGIEELTEMRNAIIKKALRRLRNEPDASPTEIQ